MMMVTILRLLNTSTLYSSRYALTVTRHVVIWMSLSDTNIDCLTD